jgi:hypothetical protein
MITPQSINRYFNLQNKTGQIKILTSNFLMRARFDEDQNHAVENFDATQN